MGLRSRTLATMPEPVLTVIAGVSAIVTNVWTTSRNLYELIDGINNAPRHIHAISADLQGIHMVLGALRGLVDDLSEDKVPGELIPMFESLEQNMDHCSSTFEQLNIKLSKYTKPSGGANRSKWAAFKWQFTEKDTERYRAHLEAYKMTVNVALNAANLYAHFSRACKQ